MSRKNLSRRKISRRLKYSIDGRQVTRGTPGFNNVGKNTRIRKTIYGKKLDEKQKVMFGFNFKNHHMKKYVQNAISNKKKDTLNYLCEQIECTLGTAVTRLIGNSRLLASQLISHKHVLLNGKKVNLARHAIKPGDIISLKDKIANIKHVQDLIMNSNHSKFDYFKFDKSKFTVELIRIPSMKDIPELESINLRSVVEFY